MNDHDYIIRDLEIMSNASQYRNWIYSTVSNSIGQRIIEVGAGIGNFTELFLDRELVIAVDSYDPCIKYLEKRFKHHTNIVPMEMDISDSKFLELSRHKPDTIICLNVLEHVMDDVQTMSNMFKILVPGGRIVLLVPAFQFLYGSIDQLVGHYRRYGKSDLLKKVSGAGFTVNRIFYMNSLAVAGWFLTNRILRQREESLKQVLFYDKFVVPLLRRAEGIVKPPFGLSLVVVGEKSLGPVK